MTAHPHAAPSALRRSARRGAALLLGGAALVVLAGCTPADGDADAAPGSPASPSSTESPSTSATPGAPTASAPASTPSASAPAPTATPTPAAPPTPADATALLVGPTSFSLVDAAGTSLGSWGYRDGTGAIAALTEAFGSAPTVSDFVPPEGYASTISAWGGFQFRDIVSYDPGDPETELPEPDFSLTVKDRSVGDVSISTLEGVAVGDASLDVRSAHPEGVVPDSAEGSLTEFRFGTTTVGGSAEFPLTNLVFVTAEDGTTIDLIVAPQVNWGV